MLSRRPKLLTAARIALAALLTVLPARWAGAQGPSSGDGDGDAGTAVFAPPPAAGARASAPSGVYGRTGAPGQFAVESAWGDDVAPRFGQSGEARPLGETGLLNRAYTNAGYSNAAALDPNVVAPQQSIGEYAEGPVLIQPERAVCEPRRPLETIRGQITWLGGDDLGFTDFEVWSKWVFPTISEYSLLTLTPGYGLHLVDGPATPDLPPQLHDLYLDIQWLNPFSREWAVELGLTPGLYGDFENGTDDAFRLGARIVGYYTMSPVWRFAAGVAYLDRDDVEFFPLGGVIWTPDPNTRLELVLPRPKYAQRFNCCGPCEDWWYVAGEFGGGSWAIERVGGLPDKANYYDWRLAVGWEHRQQAGPTMLVELGYVFNRRLEYSSGGPTFEPDDTFMLRGMIGY
jgi:hypothetical protein